MEGRYSVLGSTRESLKSLKIPIPVPTSVTRLAGGSTLSRTGGKAGPSCFEGLRGKLPTHGHRFSGRKGPLVGTQCSSSSLGVSVTFPEGLRAAISGA